MRKLLKFILIAGMIAGGLLQAAACRSMVTEKNTAPAVKPDIVAENTNEPLKVTVSTRGFEPKTIGVRSGQAIKLVFVRTDEENCGNEIVFPNLGLKKALPLNEPVTVELTAPETGEIGFTCGMDMLRGKIIVQ